MLSNNYKNDVYPRSTKSTSERYMRENKNPDVEKSGNSEFQNKRVPLDGIELLLNREKIPGELGRRMDKKNIKEINRNTDNDILSDLDDIISDAESLHGDDNKQFSHSNSRQKDRNKRRFIKRKKHRNQNLREKDFFPTSRFDKSNVLNISDNNQVNKINDEEPNDDVSDVESDGKHHLQDLDEHDGHDGHDSQDSDKESLKSKDKRSDRSNNGSDSESISGESENSNSSSDNRSESSSDNGAPNFDRKWKSPSEMTKDEVVSEKMDLLYRYSRLEKNGYKSGLNLNMRTPLETLRSEVSKLERMRNVQRSIRTQRKLLISFSSGTEYCNKRYNPYKFALDGWSGEVLENIGDYDEVFEELHDKYNDSVQMAPELKLLTMVGGSGLMFHLSNTLFKSSTPQLNDILQKNPDIMAQIQREALNSMATTNAGDPIFGMMMGGIQEKQKQQAQQPAWDGRPGYAPPRTTSGFMQNPQPSNMSTSIGADVNQVPQGQGIPVSSQQLMSGPDGFDDILSQLNNGSVNQNGLISDVEEEIEIETRNVNTKAPRKRNVRNAQKSKNDNVIDLDM